MYDAKKTPMEAIPWEFLGNWSGREDLNLRPLRPERSALARLSHAPFVFKHYLI